MYLQPETSRGLKDREKTHVGIQCKTNILFKPGRHPPKALLVVENTVFLYLSKHGKFKSVSNFSQGKNTTIILTKRQQRFTYFHC